jgi:hypothetical protein
MLPAIAALISSGLSLTANAALAKGTEWVKEKTGIDLSVASPNFTPEQLTQMKDWELKNETELAQLRVEDNRIDLQLFQAEVDDKKSARQREVELAKLSHAPWWVPSMTSVLSLIVILGGGYMFATIPDGDARYAIIGAITLVLGYHFGTTSRSSLKDKTIASMAAKE